MKLTEAVVAVMAVHWEMHDDAMLPLQLMAVVEVKRIPKMNRNQLPQQQQPPLQLTSK